MKLRRAMALAAATAVIAPATFLAAPAAFATEGDTTSPQTSADSPAPGTGAENGTENGDDTTEVVDEETPDSASSPSTDAPAPAESTPAESAEPTPGASEPGKPSPSTSTSPSAEPTATESSPAPGPVECDGDVIFDENLRTSLTGLPERIVAGSGFHGFKLNVSNKSKNTYKRVDLGVFASQVDEKTWQDDAGHLTLQYQDPTSGKWVDISLADDDEAAGYLGYTDVQPKESFSINLRLSVDKSAPAGLGYAISIGLYADDEGNCVIADDDAYYEFDIVAAGSDAGKPGEAKPQTGGQKPVQAKPAGNTQIKPEGHLAETGSSSMLPVIGTVGGIAIVAGAGVMFAMKRRRSGDATA
ncbi:LAETG motif-containing sortase-dependent surface protein [Streptomyces sp. NPDC093085]|uniref:LAETG motif-containing sortase-dependent surface protein n=1 Tax=Streptomyces sp. NPDC093085 TaxID=3155068 RepID=UPI003413E20C